MDDRKPGVFASEPGSMSAGWSLAQALDGASRRAKPKASLSRHLVGHRVAMPATAPSTEIPNARQAPEDAALVARSAQAGEAAWAHERVALIGRALDSEAKRLAADPAKAGAVAEHLAPLIEKAFAGAAAEAPGEHARAIVGREREPLETELLSERAVMSVAAKQRAERESRRAALADELAMLKEQPQRWAAAHGRRARSIDDLPLDEKRRNALKGVAARAQANAAAEGLLQQDSSWLLEDLDDPDFAGALGPDDTARWRSEAEVAVARRAERIAAESAERAQLAASDMRATLKRFKDKDDGPLPPHDAIASAFGNEAAADAELSAALKGRKQRHAESVVAPMAPADETGWIDAAPDKETRTVRELAVATKRAAVAGDPGRWLMRHSATLKELAKVATDDPTTLPRLADHYAALRRQVSGRGAVPGDAGANADTDEAPLPDAVAADLVERVLAGETPQARLEVLTTILDGAAGGDGEGFAHVDALDADDRARADAIARQLEAHGLPSGTATRWAQLTDPRMRRSARLALLGGFAKQIAEERKILSGEREEPEIVGEEGDDTISLGDIERSIPIPRGAATPALEYRKQLIRERIDFFVEDGVISREEADRFLADRRLDDLEEIELPDDVMAVLESGDRSGLVEALSTASDYILAGAEKLAELEEEYGWWIRGAVFATRRVLFGPISAVVGTLADIGIDKLLEHYAGDAIEGLIKEAGELVQGGLGVDDEATAQRIALAGIIAGSLLLGVGPLWKIVSHVRKSGLSRINSPSVSTDKPELTPELQRQQQEAIAKINASAILTANPEMQAYLTSIVQAGTGSTGKEEVLRALQGPLFDGLTPDQKQAVAQSISFNLLGHAAEDAIWDKIQILGTGRALQIMRNFGIKIPSGRPRPDLLLANGAVDLAGLRKFTAELVDSAKRGQFLLMELKGGHVDLKGLQKDALETLRAAGAENAFLHINVPIKAIPPEFIYRRMNLLIRQGNFPSPPLTETLVRQVVENLHQGLDPRTPVWVLNTLSVVALATIAGIPIAAFEEVAE